MLVFKILLSKNVPSERVTFSRNIFALIVKLKYRNVVKIVEMLEEKSKKKYNKHSFYDWEMMIGETYKWMTDMR